jgi:hypothetical protein
MAGFAMEPVSAELGRFSSGIRPVLVLAYLDGDRFMFCEADGGVGFASCEEFIFDVRMDPDGTWRDKFQAPQEQNEVDTEDEDGDHG